MHPNNLIQFLTVMALSLGLYNNYRPRTSTRIANGELHQLLFNLPYFEITLGIIRLCGTMVGFIHLLT
ncbi:hypothetical protein FF38_01397 [Lucilia cuprina]|uniref:Uncharacterized protein n=1 Tax=Lucilia cuprina TaxID=7375 RepID=A0A0L0C9W0_LUCCU|nr:hypothetical protein CVS40_8265 [Lucilia cuprina]KNC29041.1 hypothetical protein FF38_01397 [Lucilia cuprina]